MVYYYGKSRRNEYSFIVCDYPVNKADVRFLIVKRNPKTIITQFRDIDGKAVKIYQYSRNREHTEFCVTLRGLIIRFGVVMLGKIQGNEAYKIGLKMGDSIETIEMSDEPILWKEMLSEEDYNNLSKFHKSLYWTK